MRLPVHLDLRMREGLVALDDDEIDGGEPAQKNREPGLGLVAPFAHQGEAAARRDQHFAGAGLAMRMQILARNVDVEGVMRVLDGRDDKAPAREFGNERHEKRRLPRPAPAGRSGSRASAGYRNVPGFRQSGGARRSRRIRLSPLAGRGFGLRPNERSEAKRG